MKREMKIFSESIINRSISVDRKEHTVDEALANLRWGNREYCDTLCDEAIVAALLGGAIHTDLRKYWAEIK